MAKNNEVYKCDVCKQVVYVSVPGEGQLECCHAQMRRLKMDETKIFELRMPKPGSP